MDHSTLNLPAPSPSWLFVGTLGTTLVYCGIAFFILAALQQIFNRPPASGEKRAWYWRVPFFHWGCASLFGTFISLGALFVGDQFAFNYVFSHSEKVNLIPYKIAAIWSGQEGSFLLWATTSAIFALLALRGTGPYRAGFIATVSFFLACICGILAWETPFKLIVLENKIVQFPDGMGLAPSLNNYWVIIHPPTIFLGFGSLIVLFAYAVSALVKREYSEWLGYVRPWALVSMTLVGVGLCMGGFWAYETLGWGGFWMWDPVENVSFVPWVMVVTFVHGMIVQTTKKKWHFSNLLLCAASFLTFVYGTFLTRAGFLSEASVHSFAQMAPPAHKVLLGFLIAIIAGFLGLWFYRMNTHRAEMARKGIKEEVTKGRGTDREKLYQFGMVLLIMFGAATAIGMSVPLLQSIANKPVKVVNEHLYHQVLGWFFVPLMLLMAIAPFSSWRRMPWISQLGRVINVASVTLGITGIAMFVFNNPSIGVNPDSEAKIHLFGNVEVPNFGWIVFLFSLCVFVAVANIWRLVEVFKRSKMSSGPFLSHLGVAVALTGLIVSRGFERQQVYFVQPGSTAVPTEKVGPRHLVELVQDQKWDMENRDNKIEFKLTGDGQDFVARPGLFLKRDLNTGEYKPMAWPYIQSFPTHDIYVAIEEPTDDVQAPKSFKPGETITLGGPLWETFDERPYAITFDSMVRDGNPGAVGTSFTAKVTISDIAGHKTAHSPKLVIGEGGALEHVPAKLDEDFSLDLAGMNVNDKSVLLALKYNRPVIRMHTFYKPLTLFVWLGVGILMAGGFLTAWHRRRRSMTISTEPLVENVETNDDALVPVA